MSRQSRRHPVLVGYAFLLSAWLILPTLVIVPVSFSSRASFSIPSGDWSLRWYKNFFADPQWFGALVNSLIIAALAATLATVVGTLAALGIHRSNSKRNRTAVQAVLLSPRILPDIVLAVGVYAAYLRLGLVGTIPGFVIAHAALGMPLVLIAVTASLAGLDRQLENAATTLGANPWSTARQITIPLILPGIASGGLLAFMASFDEVIIAIFIQSPYLETLPVVIFSSMIRSTDPTIAAAATLILATTITLLSLIAIIFSGRTRRIRKLEQ